MDIFWHRKLTLKVRILPFLTTFAQLSARLKNFLGVWLLVLGIEEALVECATVCVKSVYLYPFLMMNSFVCNEVRAWLLKWMLRYHCTVHWSSIYLAQMKTHWFEVVFVHAWSLEFVIEGKKSEKSDFVKKSPKLQYLFFPKESEKRNNSGRVSKFLHLCYFPGSQV